MRAAIARTSDSLSHFEAGIANLDYSIGVPSDVRVRVHESHRRSCRTIGAPWDEADPTKL